MTLFTVFATYLLLGALAGTLAGLFGIVYSDKSV